MHKRFDVNKKRTVGYEWKARKRRVANNAQQALLKKKTSVPTTARGFQRLGIYSLYVFAQLNNIQKSKATAFLADMYGRAKSSLPRSFTRIMEDYEKTHSFDVFDTHLEDSEQKKAIIRTIKGYLDGEGKVITNPTYHQHINNVRAECDLIDLAPPAISTIAKHTLEFEWTYRDPSQVTKLEDIQTMAKRVDFVDKLIPLMKSESIEILWMDEMTFFVNKNRAKRLGPILDDKVFFDNITPSKCPGLSVTTYMTKDRLIHIDSSWDTTTSKSFESCLKKALLEANKVLDPRKDICIILDNAPYHDKAAVASVVREINDKNKADKKRQRCVDVLFTSPNSPDLNLVEYFNRHYKATLRRAIDNFDYLTIKREDRRGRPPKDPLKQELKKQKVNNPRHVVVVFSHDNIISLAKYVYERIKQEQYPIGTWYKSYNHVFKWALALQETKGNYKHASSVLSQIKSSIIPDIIPSGRIVTSQSDKLISVRLGDIDLSSLVQVKSIDFTREEVNQCAKEVGVDNPNHIRPLADSDENDTESDDENILKEDEADSDQDSIAINPPPSQIPPNEGVKRKAAKQLGSK